MGSRVISALSTERLTQVESVVVADDCAVDGGPITGRRGIAGTVFVHKIAGMNLNYREGVNPPYFT